MSIFEKLKRGIVTISPQESQNWASEFTLALPENQVITLSGDLGAGKTTWVKGMAQALNIEDSVISPSFNIYQLYKGNRQLIHMDAYRLENAEQLDALVIEDLLEEPWLVAYEWPERGLSDWMEGRIWALQIKIKAPGIHEISLSDMPEDPLPEE